MGYKRKARIVFLAGGDNNLALMAAGFANTLGAQWIEGRAAASTCTPPHPAVVTVMQEAGVSLVEQTLSSPDPALLAWADLIVTLDAEAEKICPPLPPHVQKNYFPLETASPPSTMGYRIVLDAIRTRIEGMIGGMVMVQKDSAEN